jgi:hypothetical protein
VKYYTFRILEHEPLKLECCKWEECREPTARHIVYPDIEACNCFATKRDCVHVRRAKEITRSADLMRDMMFWKWDEHNGWTENHDVPDFDEFARVVSLSE